MVKKLANTELIKRFRKAKWGTQSYNKVLKEIGKRKRAGQFKV